MHRACPPDRRCARFSEAWHPVPRHHAAAALAFRRGHRRARRAVQRAEWSQADAVAGIESRGFILAAALADKRGKGFVPIRKKGKLPPPVVDRRYARVRHGRARNAARRGPAHPGGRRARDRRHACGLRELATDAGFRVMHVGVLIDLGIAKDFRCLGEAPRIVIRYGALMRPPSWSPWRLPAEGAGVFEAAGIPVLYTGVGKVNAAIALARRLARFRAHGGRMPLSSISARPAVRAAGARSSPAALRGTRHGRRRARLRARRDAIRRVAGDARVPRCFTNCPRPLWLGRFVRDGPHAVACDVVDMEAYALAKACRIAGAEFACAKYVSDGADEHAAVHWRANVAGAADRFLALYRDLAQPA